MFDLQFELKRAFLTEISAVNLIVAEIAFVSQIWMIVRIDLAFIDIFNDLADGYFRSFTQLRDRAFAVVLQILCTAFQLGANEGVAFRTIF